MNEIIKIQLVAANILLKSMVSLKSRQKIKTKMPIFKAFKLILIVYRFDKILYFYDNLLFNVMPDDALYK